MKRRKGKKAAPTDIVPPTPEREAHNETQSLGMARRIVPEIVRLHKLGVLNDHQFKALAYYRDQASLADKSPLRSGCDFSVRAGGSGPGVAIISAQRETWRMERDMGALWELARAVAVDDVSLRQWCINRYGGVERDKGIVPVREKFYMERTRLELKFCAGRIVV